MNASENRGVMKVIGTTIRHFGHEIPGLNGRRVRIFAVMRDDLRPDVDLETDDYVVSDDDVLAQFGGVTALDRVAQLGVGWRASFVHCDPRAIDLECFAHFKG